MQPDNPIVDELTEAAKAMIRAGHSEDRVLNALISLAMTWAFSREGPRAVSDRLHGLAMQAAALTDQSDRDREGRAH